MKHQPMHSRCVTKEWRVSDPPAATDPIWYFGVGGGGIGIGLAIWMIVAGVDSRPESFVSNSQPTHETVTQAAPTVASRTFPVTSDASLTLVANNELPNPIETEKLTNIPRAPLLPPSLAPSEIMPLVPIPVMPEPTRRVAAESELLQQLRDMPEFGLRASTRDAMVVTYKNSYQASATMGRRPTFDASILLKHMPTAQQLPLRGFPSCQLNPFIAVSLGRHSRALRTYLDVLAPKDATGKRADPKDVRTKLRQERRGKPPAWLHQDAIPAMVQILGTEEVPLRLILVDLLADIPGKVSSNRLAQRAVFDVSPKVRSAAIDALRQRPQRESRRTLVEAMQHPWAMAADHAAEALIALGDRDAAPLLVAQLDKPNPNAPFATKTGHSIREVVRVNHFQNCLLCHVPAVGRDPVTDVDPFATRPTQTYQVGSYSGPKLPGSAGGVWANRVLIRADVQLLRQDFSVTFPNVGNSDSNQRFDFLVRKRPVEPDELPRLKTYTDNLKGSYPQRESILFALRKLTGQDAGPTTEAWVKLYPHAKAESEGVRIADSLKAGTLEQREQLLARYRDAKESHVSDGLAHAIPLLSNKMQERVRGVLVDRMARLSTDELRDYLDEDGELHRAAGRACIRKADPTFIPELIGLLTEDGDVSAAALQALKKLTNEDFGPKPGSTQQERETAMAKWQDWYLQQGS